MWLCEASDRNGTESKQTLSRKMGKWSRKCSLIEQHYWTWLIFCGCSWKNSEKKEETAHFFLHGDMSLKRVYFLQLFLFLYAFCTLVWVMGSRVLMWFWATCQEQGIKEKGGREVKGGRQKKRSLRRREKQNRNWHLRREENVIWKKSWTHGIEGHGKARAVKMERKKKRKGQ